MKRGDVWYFAFGSNMSKERKQQRTARIREARVVRLKDYSFAFNKRGDNGEIYANVVRRKGGVVWGVVYLCSLPSIAKLDEKEGVKKGHYSHKMIEVIDAAGEKLQALAYVAGQEYLCEKGCPPEWYLDLILKGAKEHGLPSRYSRKIKALAVVKKSAQNRTK